MQGDAFLHMSCTFQLHLGHQEPCMLKKRLDDQGAEALDIL